MKGTGKAIGGCVAKAACRVCQKSHQTHIHIHISTSHTKAGPARGRFVRRSGVLGVEMKTLPVNTYEYCA